MPAVSGQKVDGRVVLAERDVCLSLYCGQRPDVDLRTLKGGGGGRREQEQERGEREPEGGVQQSGRQSWRRPNMELMVSGVELAVAEVGGP